MFIRQILGLASLLMTSIVYADKLVIIGDAYALNTGQLLYQEFHYYSEDGLDHHVVYISPEKTKIAEKFLNYRSGKASPEVNHQAWVYAEKFQITKAGKQWFLAYTDNENRQSKTTLVATRPLVIDAGFDHYIRQHWSSLLTGSSVKFDFPAPSRLSLVGLLIKRKRCTGDQLQAICFAINSSNWFIRLLLDPIELSYDKNTRQLIRFKGLGNMLDKYGNSLKVNIRYRYQDLCIDQTVCDQEVIAEDIATP